MSDVPTIELRRGVNVPGIPVSWNTNLSDVELSEVYHQLKKRSFFFSKVRPDESIMVDGTTITSNLQNFDLILGTKTYRGWGTPKEVTIVYRPDSDWTLFDEEKRLEQANLDRKNEIIAKEETIIGLADNDSALNGGPVYPAGSVNGIRKSGEAFVLQNNFTAAEKAFRSAIRLLVIHNIDPDNIFGYRKDYLIRHPALNLIELYAKSRKLIKGINFIRSLQPHEKLWLYFGETLEHEKANSLAVAVYKEALNDHPQSMAIHKRLAIVLRTH